MDHGARLERYHCRQCDQDMPPEVDGQGRPRRRRDWGGRVRVRLLCGHRADPVTDRQVVAGAFWVGEDAGVRS